MIPASHEVVSQRLSDVAAFFQEAVWDEISPPAGQKKPEGIRVKSDAMHQVLFDLDGEFSDSPLNTMQMFALLKDKVADECFPRINSTIKRLCQEGNIDVDISELEGLPDMENSWSAVIPHVVRWDSLLPTLSGELEAPFLMGVQIVSAYMEYSYTGDSSWRRIADALMDAMVDMMESFMGVLGFVFLVLYVEVVLRGKTPQVELDFAKEG